MIRYYVAEPILGTCVAYALTKSQAEKRRKKVGGFVVAFDQAAFVKRQEAERKRAAEFANRRCAR